MSYEIKPRLKQLDNVCKMEKIIGNHVAEIPHENKY